MKHYIDKSALVAEINRVLNSYDPNEITSGRYALISLRDFLDTLEVKEVQEEPVIVDAPPYDYVKGFSDGRLYEKRQKEEPVSIWHDVSRETPTGFGKAIIVLCRNKNMEDGIWLADLIQDWEGEWEPRTNWETPVKWAYVKDLINLTLSEATNIGEEEPVSDDLENAAIEECSKLLKGETVIIDGYEYVVLSDAEECFKAGAKWQKENLWKPADGDDLPEYEREVVVFTQNYPDDAGIMSVAIGHRPNPDGYDGKSLTTGEVEHYIPETYGKGGWNIPDVKWWLDCSLPNMEED